MKIYDDILPKALLTKVQDMILHEATPWTFNTTTYKGATENLYGYSWGHIALDQTGPKTQAADTLHTAILIALEKAEVSVKEIYRIRLGLLTVSSERHINDPHIDIDSPHKTGLIYLNDADGATVFYENKYNLNSKLDGTKYFEKVVKPNLKIAQEVDPVANRMVLFDGLTYHSSSTPMTVPRRVVLNFNFN
jgi:hypothetical protein